MKRLSVIALVFIMSATTLNADLITSNISEPISGDWSIWQGGWLATSFNPGDSNYDLTSGVVSMYRLDSDLSSLFVAVYSDDSNQPDTELTRFQYDPGDLLFNQTAGINLWLNQPFPLHANTNYWMVVGSTESAFTVASAQTESGLLEIGPGSIGTAKYKSNASGGNWQNEDQHALLMSLSGNAVPEPTSVIVLMTLLFISAFRIRDRRSFRCQM